MKCFFAIAALCLLLGGQGVAQEAEPVLLPDSAWDRPLPITLLDIRVLPLDALAIAQLREDGWLLVLEGAYEDGMAMWERRYDAIMDYLTTSGFRIVPAKASSLGILRVEVMARIEQDGTNWSDETETAWIEYHKKLGQALHRREAFSLRRNNKER